MAKSGSLTEEELLGLYRTMISVLRAKPLGFIRLCKRLKQRSKKTGKYINLAGLCHWEYIELNVKEDLISTTVHEMIHYLEPTWSERYVLRMESRLMNFLSLPQIAELLSEISRQTLPTDN